MEQPVNILSYLTGAFVPNRYVKDRNLSLKAMGLLVELLSLPEESRTIEGVARYVKDGRDAIRTAMKELEAAGIIAREQKVSQNGMFSGTRVVFKDWEE